MTAVESALLALTAAAIHAEAPTDPKLSASDWMELFRLADRHKLLPLTADAAAPLPSLRAAVQDGLDWNKILSAVFTQVNSQMIQENELLNLLTDLRAEGLAPLVLKGPILRALYPRPLLRPSVDDDLFVPPDRVADYHRAFLAQGLTA
ncbi:MAG: nucleotidyltransferase family protein, partial [Oscillospiraceae bacterium]|nr:nucleotidyltransferase family protein [Oscillospiraceae bacterium]